MMLEKYEYAGRRGIGLIEGSIRAAARAAPTYIQNRTMVTMMKFNCLNDHVQ